MKGKYLHAERCCSYFVPCEVIEYKVKHREEFQSTVEKLFNIPLKEGLGAVIEFIDEFEDYRRIWTTLDRVVLD